jgi:uncharacterized protein (DUF2141 family)
MGRRLFLLAAILAGIPGRSGADEGGNRIEVSIESLHSDRGQVLCALQPQGTHSAAAPLTARGMRTTIERGKARCVFDNVSPGSYVVGVIHDENGNGKLDTNFLGIPREGVGVSRDAKGILGPPRMSDATFAYSGGVLTLVVHVRYL